MGATQTPPCQQYVALLQEGMVLTQTALAVGEDARALQTLADAKAQALNDAQQGEALGWTAVVLPVDHK